MWPMPLTGSDFVELLTTACPETQSIIAEHLDDHGNELLLHLLIADIRRFTVDRFNADDTATLRRCLDAVSTGLTEGDQHLENAVAVSFVEDTGWWDREMQPFMAEWPAPLVAEAERQREWQRRAAHRDDS